jgi:hypothetical protein
MPCDIAKLGAAADLLARDTHQGLIYVGMVARDVRGARAAVRADVVRLERLADEVERDAGAVARELRNMAAEARPVT